MRLSFVIHSLAAGGSERVLSLMANHWAAQAWDVTVHTFDDGTVAPFYDLDSRVHYVPLGIACESFHLIAGIWNNLKRIVCLRRAISREEHEAIISFGNKTNIVTLFATWGLGLNVIVSERTDPHMYSIGRVWEGLRRWAYTYADRIVVQTEAAREYFLPNFRDNLSVIPNPVALSPAGETSLNNQPAKCSIMAMGRLSEEKGFDLLLQAFGSVMKNHPGWTLTILGEGPERGRLELLSERLGISDWVRMPGLVPSPWEYLRRADFFVLSSRFEGFPNALCEAMACGVPVISTDCPSGPRGIIRDGEDGVLVRPNDVDELAAAMEFLMTDESARNRLGNRALEVTSRFSVERVMKMWEDILS